MNGLSKFIIILMACALFLTSQADAQNQRKPDLVIATPLAYPPFSSLDALGYVHGFSISFMQALCKEMNIYCLYYPMGFNEMFQAVANNEVDAAIGAISILPEREKDYAFTVPFLATQINFLASTVNGKKLITNITPKSISGKSIALRMNVDRVDVRFYVRTLRDASNLKLKYYNEGSDLIEALVHHKVDLALVDTAFANFWANQTQNIYIVGDPISINLGIGIMLNKERPELLQKLNAAILKFTVTNHFKEMLNTFFTPFSQKTVTQN